MAVCNLASISLKKFVTAEGVFDHQRLFDIASVYPCLLPPAVYIGYILQSFCLVC